MGTGLLGHALGAVALCACGRVGFEPASTSSDGRPLRDDGVTNADASPPQPKCTTTYAAALLCDDFEVDLDQWTIVADGSNQVVRDTGFARSGAASAHSIGNEAGSARLIASSLGGVKTGTLYVRFYQWLPTGPTIQDVSILHLVSNMSPYPGIVLTVGATTVTVLSTINTTTYGPDGQITLPRDEWTCVQETLAVGASGSVLTSIDSAPAAMFMGNTIPDTNGYTDVHVGVYLSQSNPVDVWVDDVVVDTQPIPCD